MVFGIAFSLWLTGAIYSNQFTAYDNVTLRTSKSGLALPQRADVKLRGMIVGVVRDVRVDDDQVVMTLGMDPALIGRVPRHVRAEIVPKTLFGEKYVALVPTASGAGQHLRAGDTISDAVVPVEFEKFFNDVYPLLTAVPPEKVAYTLTALAETLKGRGDLLGQTFVDSNEYLKKFNPENQKSIDDIVALGRVSQAYTGQMDNFGQLLENSADLSETVTDKQDELEATFKGSGRLADVLDNFLDASGDDIIATARNSVQPLQVGAEYSTMYPCFFPALNALGDVTDQVFMNGTLHGAMAPITKNPEPSRYGLSSDPEPEHPIVPTEANLESLELVQPEIHGYRPNPKDPDNPYPAGLGTICDELRMAAAGKPRTKPLPVPGTFWKLFGLRNSHNGAIGVDTDYNRAGIAGESRAPVLRDPSRK